MKNYFIHLFLCRYLQKDKVNGPEGNTVYYELAERALDGPMNDRIKEYISQVILAEGPIKEFHKTFMKHLKELMKNLFELIKIAYKLP